MSLNAERAANLAENPYAGQGPVLLDVGGDVGALVVHLPSSLEGAEVEIRTLDEGEHEQGHEHEPEQGHEHEHAHEPEQGHEHEHEHHHDGHSHDNHVPHVAVVARPVGGSVAHSAVFPGLMAGRYELRIRDEDEHERVCVDVPGARVIEVTWPR